MMNKVREAEIGNDAYQRAHQVRLPYSIKACSCGSSIVSLDIPRMRGSVAVSDNWRGKDFRDITV